MFRRTAIVSANCRSLSSTPLLYKADRESYQFCLSTAYALLFLYLSLTGSRLALKMLICSQKPNSRA